jgi:hypothetical protein
MTPEQEKEFEQLKLTVQGLEETLNKLQTCAIVMKEVVGESTNVDLDDLIEKRMKV